MFVYGVGVGVWCVSSNVGAVDVYNDDVIYVGVDVDNRTIIGVL